MAENSVLSRIQHHPDEGSLTFQGVRYLLIRPETLASVQKQIETEVGAQRAGELLYAGGFTGGQLSGRKYRDAFEFTERQAVEFMCRMGGEIGWGRFRLLVLSPEKRLLQVEVDSSPFAVAYGEPTGQAVCHWIRGVLGGLVSGLFSTEVRAAEPLCLAKGDPVCRFVVEGQR